MASGEVEHWLARARQQIDQSHLDGAIESLKRVLTEDPDHASAHALLAICLMDKHRLYAARHEAGIALALEPTLPLCHYAMGAVLMAQRDFKQAEAHLQQLLQTLPDDPAYYRAMAELYGYTGRSTRIEPMLVKALELDPGDPVTLVALGYHYLGRGEVHAARQKAEEALHLEPEQLHALVLMGQVLLRVGELQDAREHALSALRLDGEHRGALYLLAALKARSNPLLGGWWRFNTWLNERGSVRAMTVLLGAYLTYSLLTTVAMDFGRSDIAATIRLSWLALVIYTWIGPALFRRSLKKEFQSVRIVDDF